MNTKRGLSSAHHRRLGCSGFKRPVDQNGSQFKGVQFNCTQFFVPIKIESDPQKCQD